MAILPGYNPQTLEDVLGQQAQSSSANLTDQYIQAKKRAVAGEAASGRLMSGVSDYPLTDLQTEYTQGESGIQDNLANTLYGIPSEDWLNQQNYNRGLGLANEIGRLNRPNRTQNALAGAGAGASAGAAFGPWGAAVGGVAGGLYGAFGS